MKKNSVLILILFFAFIFSFAAKQQGNTRLVYKEQPVTDCQKWNNQGTLDKLNYPVPVKQSFHNLAVKGIFDTVTVEPGTLLGGVDNIFTTVKSYKAKCYSTTFNGESFSILQIKGEWYRPFSQMVVNDDDEYVVVDIQVPDSQESPSVSAVADANCDQTADGLKIGQVPTPLSLPLPEIKPPVKEKIKVAKNEVQKNPVEMTVETTKLSSDDEEDWKLSTPVNEKEVGLKKSNNISGTEINVEHELDVGAGFYCNHLVNGDWAYIEYLMTKDDHFGKGFRFIYDAGDGKVSRYEWLNLGIGPEGSGKNTSKDSTGRITQDQVKIWLLAEWMSGKNDDQKYEMHRFGTPIGAYLEHRQDLNLRSRFILTAEGKLDLWNHFNSSLEGDEASDQSMLSLALYYQYDLSSSWSIKLGGGPRWTAWDSLVGLDWRVEAGYDKWLFFGPDGTIYPFGGISHAYPGFSAGDLTTYGALARVELRKIVRETDKKVRAKKVQPVSDNCRTQLPDF